MDEPVAGDNVTSPTKDTPRRPSRRLAPRCIAGRPMHVPERAALIVVLAR